MSARSSLTRWSARPGVARLSARSSLALLLGGPLLLLLGGCDLVFDVEGGPSPCDLGSFDGAKTLDIAPSQGFSIDWDQTFAVNINENGFGEEIVLPDGMPKPIDLGPYDMVLMSLAPEGTSLLYTASTEPPLLEGALRAGPTEWKLDARVPAATFAGTPSADVFGPRRMLVRLRDTDTKVVELEDDSGAWKPVGDAHELPSLYAPNLTPDGLTAVFTQPSQTETGVANEVFAMTRTSTAEWFGTPAKILSNGNDQFPQLLGHCDRLYTVHDGTMRRYAR